MFAAKPQVKENFLFNTMKYIIYARKSTEDDNHQVLSIESQLCELREFAAKEKLEIVASLCEAKTAKEPVKNTCPVKFAKQICSGSSRTTFCKRKEVIH